MTSQRKSKLLIALAAAVFGAATVADAAPDTQALKTLSFDELSNIEVTSVSKRPQKLSEAAAAIEVITQDDIHRSGATTIPEALRLAGNLELVQINAAQWMISARGFNAPLSNKMLVLIDGRTVYTPLFSGVFWEAQDVLLEDIERIEVISGPGATVWGANAVNGVINIMTRGARDTQGLYLEATGGDLITAGAVRYGGAISENTHFRAYGKYAEHGSTVSASGVDPGNDVHHGQGGFRLDSVTSGGDLLTLQSDLYENTIDVPPQEIVARGANVLGRWSRKLSDDSDFKLQVYFDRMHRDSPGSYEDWTTTYDVDFQHQLAVGTRHNIVWGAGYRQVRDDFRSGSIGLRPERVSLETISAFVQDEIALVPDRLHLTVGTKIEDNEYTDKEWQPSVRLAWQLRARQMLWTAVSRALRTPARIDRSYYAPPVSIGSPDLQSEKLIAYEVGYRAQPHERVSLSVAGYYHDYDDIRSIEPANPPVPLPVVFLNGQEGKTYGAELSAEYRVTDAWRLRAGVSELRIDIRPKPGSLDNSFGLSEAADSKHHALLRSSMDLPHNLQLDATLRYVSRLENVTVAVPGYSDLDLHLAWLATDQLELAVVGQNLLHDRHPEIGVPAVRQEIERTAYARISWRY
ncbi:MAG TPA: TonB-dependent receptor [Steroidobacteraceae bacterium]|nr:TonB-dependent receptor [Steroidobacteraceae bacterium]